MSDPRDPHAEERRLARIRAYDDAMAEAEQEREHRQELGDPNPADEIRSVADGFTSGPVENPTDRLVKAEIGLQCCNGKQESQAAIREFFAAKAEALKVTAPSKPPKPGRDGWTPEQRVAHYWRNHDQKFGR